MVLGYLYELSTLMYRLAETCIVTFGRGKNIGAKPIRSVQVFVESTCSTCSNLLSVRMSTCFAEVYSTVNRFTSLGLANMDGDNSDNI